MASLKKHLIDVRHLHTGNDGGYKRFIIKLVSGVQASVCDELERHTYSGHMILSQNVFCVVNEQYRKTDV